MRHLTLERMSSATYVIITEAASFRFYSENRTSTSTIRISKLPFQHWWWKRGKFKNGASHCRACQRQSYTVHSSCIDLERARMMTIMRESARNMYSASPEKSSGAQCCCWRVGRSRVSAMRKSITEREAPATSSALGGRCAFPDVEVVYNTHTHTHEAEALAQVVWYFIYTHVRRDLLQTVWCAVAFRWRDRAEQRSAAERAGACNEIVRCFDFGIKNCCCVFFSDLEMYLFLWRWIQFSNIRITQNKISNKTQENNWVNHSELPF